MADIELVIKIPEGHYKTLQQMRKTGLGFYHQAILNGTILPKGHGDLVDLGKMCDDYWDGNYMEIHKDDLPNIPIIIKADKESN